METIGMPTVYIKHKGVFNLSEILQGIIGFLEKDAFKVHYPKHKYKVPSPKGGEHEIKIYGERKINEYVKFKIDVFMRVFDFKEVEMLKEGKKVMMNTGRIAVEISGSMTLDFENRFGGNKFLQALQDFYHKHIIHRDIGDVWEDDLMLKIVNLGKLIREKCQQEALT